MTTQPPPEAAAPSRLAGRADALETVASALSAAATPDEIGRVAVEQLGVSLGAPSGAMAVLAANGRLRVAASNIAAWKMVDYQEFPLDASLPAADAVRSAEPVFVETAAELASRYPHLAFLLEAGWRAWAAIPLMLEGRALGAIWLSFRHERAFGEDDVRFMMTVAHQTAQAVARAQLFVAERTARERANRLEAVAAALSAAATLEEGAQAALDQMASALEAAGGALAVLEPDANRLRLLSWTGANRERFDPYRHIPLAAPLPVTDAVRLGHPVLVEGPAEVASRYPALAGVVDPRYGAWAAIPLVVEGRSVGAAWFIFEGERKFSPDDVSTMLSIARQAAQALARMMLFEAERTARARAERVAARTQRLQRVTAKLSGVLSPDEVAAVAVDEGLEALGADSAALWRIDENARAIGLVRSAGVPAGTKQAIATFALDSDYPIAVAARTGDAVWVDSWTERMAAQPGLGDVRQLTDATDFASACVPVQVAGRVFGALTVSFRRRYVFDAEERAFITLVARHAAEALDRARMFAELQAAVEAAKLAERRKDEFLAILGHELRNPLAPILTALDVMRMRGDGAARERVVIERQVRHLERLVDDLLDVSRITRGAVELRREPVEIAAVVAKAVELASPLLEQKGHRLELAMDGEGLAVEADPVRLAQVVTNLLVNAARYMAAGGEVHVTAAVEAGEVVLRVRDRGDGIAPDLLPHLFVPFVQGPRSLARSEGGLGLGLAIVKQLVEAHGGRVAAASDGPGRGAEFTVRLPHVGAAPGAAAALAGPRPAPVAARRVLVVDDNEDAAVILGEALEASGFTVAVAHDGPQALRIAEILRPEIAVLDLGLPVMDGYELARRLRDAHGAGLRLVALSGYGQDSDLRRTRAAGFAEHLVKPVDLGRLVDVLEAA